MAGNGSPPARELYSGLRFLLEEQHLTVADLARRGAALGEAIDVRTLRRLADPARPRKLVDARVVERACRALGIGLGDFLVLVEPPAPRLSTLPRSAAARAHGAGEGEVREVRLDWGEHRRMREDGLAFCWLSARLRDDWERALGRAAAQGERDREGARADRDDHDR